MVNINYDDAWLALSRSASRGLRLTFGLVFNDETTIGLKDRSEQSELLLAASHGQESLLMLLAILSSQTTVAMMIYCFVLASMAMRQ